MAYLKSDSAGIERRQMPRSVVLMEVQMEPRTPGYSLMKVKKMEWYLLHL